MIISSDSVCREFDVEDVGFVKESLQHLPYVPSLSFLRQEILVGPKTYFQIVGTMLLHQKMLSPTEKRHAIYNFPGFCSGCLRMGLCYGCERSSQLHYHTDRKMKTGGGFTYFKKDKAEKEIKSKNPSNWKINDPNRTLKRLMEDFAGVDLEGPIPDKVSKHMDQYEDGTGDQRDRNVGLVAGDQDRELDGLRQGEAEADYLGHSDSDLDLHDDGFEEDLELIARYNSQGEEVGEGDIDLEGRGEDYGDQDSSRGRVTDQPYLAVPSSGFPHILTPDFGDKRTGQFAGDSLGGNTEEGLEHRLPKYRKTDSEDDEGEEIEGDRGGGGDDLFGRQGRKRERLYRAPPPFKPRKSPSRRIEAKSPFSTNRKLNVPSGRVFQVKKSDKPLTQFEEFNSSDVSWKEPKKFELKKSESKTTQFWSGAPPSRKKDKKYERKARSLSPPRKKKVSTSSRSRSPDSGIGSGVNAAPTKAPPLSISKGTAPKKTCPDDVNKGAKDLKSLQNGKERNLPESQGSTGLDAGGQRSSTKSSFSDSLKSGLEPVREETFTPTPPGSPYRPPRKMVEPRHEKTSCLRQYATRKDKPVCSAVETRWSLEI